MSINQIATSRQNTSLTGQNIPKITIINQNILKESLRDNKGMEHASQTRTFSTSIAITREITGKHMPFWP